MYQDVENWSHDTAWTVLKVTIYVLKLRCDLRDWSEPRHPIFVWAGSFPQQTFCTVERQTYVYSMYFKKLSIWHLTANTSRWTRLTLFCGRWWTFGYPAFCVRVCQYRWFALSRSYNFYQFCNDLVATTHEPWQLAGSATERQSRDCAKQECATKCVVTISDAVFLCGTDCIQNCSW